MKEKKTNRVVLLLGSNIDPEKNIFSALELLGEIKKSSRIWKTASYGTIGPDFLNLAVELETELGPEELKVSVIAYIERALHRIRTTDKNAPRTIDIDIITFNRVLLDHDVWVKAFAAIPVAELLPELVNPETGMTLSDFAQEMKSSAHAELYQP